MTEKIYIDGMTCTACSSGIESALKRKNGIQDIKVDLLNHNAIIVFDETQISLETIFAFIQKLGYQPYKQNFIEKFDEHFLTPKRKIILSCIFTSIVLYLSMFAMSFPALVPDFLTHPINLALQIVCTLIVMHLGRGFYIKGFKSLYALHPTMDSLVALGSGSAFVFSLFMILHNPYQVYFESVCAIILFVLIGKTIEEKAKYNTQNSLLTLASLKDCSAIRITNHLEETIAIQQIQIGDILKILPQSLIPTEGVLIEGSANLDLSSLNGESLPIHKKQGDLLSSGSRNLNTTFLMQATQVAQESFYHQILDLVQNALISKAPIAKIADKISLYFVPSVIIIALLAGILWAYFSDITFGIIVFCSVLLISCPCALGLATPLALNIANNLAHKKGMFFKDAQVLELISHTEVVFFDKTGTLTQKELSLQNITSCSSLTQEEILQISASLEQESHHIIAQCLLQEAQNRSIRLLTPQALHINEGFGIAGQIDSVRYKIGNAKSFNPAPTIQDEGIAVFLGIESEDKDQILGYLILQEALRQEAQAMIANLKKQNILPILLSGDHSSNVSKIAQILQIPFVADALPQDKLSTIQSYTDKTTMMVGDGINDILALSQADISVSMGEGSTEAIASSNLVILNNHLDNIPYSIALSRATLRNIKENLFWAFGYNALMIPIACGALYGFGIMLNPMIASLAMTLSSLSVVLNAQRLKTFQGETHANTKDSSSQNDLQSLHTKN
ncbi:hypothetical protein BBW65_06350 [Helicobacter enhydrae]|uniref:Copper-transporting ATPase n=1 Tax=Helicobacter enhydrae TaxID=222136 RepID=A0A1B1U7U8_9HELI|nr:hypothetical protein BBW65_06350 [Helicobacter enhydrae]